LVRINPKSKQHGILLKVQETNNGRKGAILVSFNGRSGNVEVKARGVSIHQWILVATFAPPTPVVDGDQIRAKAFTNGTVEVFINNISLGTVDADSFYANKGGQIGLWFLGWFGDKHPDDDDDKDLKCSAQVKDDEDCAKHVPGGRPLFDNFGGGTIITAP